MGHLKDLKSWSVETRIRLLQSQILNNMYEQAAYNLSSLVTDYSYCDPFPLDRLLYCTRFKSSQTFLKLVHLGFLNKIPMAPGYVNSVLIQQATLADSTPSHGVPKVFAPAPVHSEQLSGTSLKIDECVEWALQFGEMGYPISERAWGVMIKRIIQQRGAASGLSTFRYLRRKAKLGPNVVIYCQIIHGFVAAGNLRMAEDIYSEMHKENAPKNEIVRGALLNGYVKAKDIKKVQQHLSMESSTEPQLITTTMLINLAASTSASMKTAEQLYVNFIQSGGSPDQHLMGTMLMGYFMHRDKNGVRRVFEEMERRNMEPDLFALNILMAISAQEMDIEKVMLVLDRILGQGMEPNLRSYHMLMDLLGAHGKIDEVEALFSTLLSKNLSPTLYTFNCLIIGHIRSGEPLKAFKTYKSLKCSGIEPSAFTIGILFSAISQYQLFQFSEQLFQDIHLFNVDKNNAILKSQLSSFHDSLTICNEAHF
ncbi:hypothetical protein DSO57_1015964 [Entomophthora muscae]|uniref:Uncharacterized protein n=1 Tax=Entomophthora muscae TaxID=34485 RepID=A0ACC2T547_9FUNG|nr:hypothetical protein DSO57_1015964 [Entomophthora muscae]